MKKERIIVIGLGKEFGYYQQIIFEKYDVVAVSDSRYSKEKCIHKDTGFKYIPINMLDNNLEYDKILICTKRYYWQLWNILVRVQNINKNKIFDFFIQEELNLYQLRKSLSVRIEKYEKDIDTYQKLYEYTKESNGRDFQLYIEKTWPLITQYDKPASSIQPFYFQFEQWCAEQIYCLRPKHHYNIGGRMEGFINRLMTFGQKVTMIDIRPLELHLDGLDFICADAVTLENIEDESIESLSCLGCVESYGLGRWGDPVDPQAWYKGLKSMQRVTKSGGRVYIATPVGKERLEFNARRVFSPTTIAETMNEMELEEFSVAETNNLSFIKNCDLHKYDEHEGTAQILGCFCFRKR